MQHDFRGRLGLALGSGAARGWAHIGVIRALEEAGLAPSVVCGSSVGAVVGAAYAAGKLDAYEAWVRELDWRAVVGYFDVSLRGGLIKARRVFEFLASQLPDERIEHLGLDFAAVATDLATGQEVWLRQGPVLEALRASVALPGLITPVRLEGRWLLDGGLVNPVPVSLCRALGADTVIAVDLNGTLLRRRRRMAREEDRGVVRVGAREEREGDREAAAATDHPIRATLDGLANDLRARFSRESRFSDEETPGIVDVVLTSINIMQMRITRSRIAGDPPDLLVTPRLPDFALFDFDRADEAIAEGRRAVAQALAAASRAAPG